MKRACVLLTPVLLLTLLLRLPAFFQPAWYGDEGIFAAVADAVGNGGSLYVDAWDNKPPGIFLVYLAASLAPWDLMALRLLDLAAALGTVAFVFLSGRRLAGEGAGLLAAAVCGLALGLPTFEAHLANTESYMTLFSSAGVYILLRSLDPEAPRPRGGLLLAGTAFGVALLFKQVAALEAFAALLFLALHSRGEVRRIGLFCGGAALPVALTAGVFLAAGTLPDLWQATVASLAGYRGGAPALAELAIAGLPMTIALPYAIATQPWRTRSLEALPSLWLAFAALGVAAAGRSYPHYLLPLAAPGALLLVAWLGSRPRLPRAQVAAGVAVACLAVYHVFIGPWGWVAWNDEPRHTRDYYAAFLRYARGEIDSGAYHASFDSNTPWRLQLTREVSELRVEQREVFVWGDHAWLYPLGGLRNPTRYFTLFQAIEREGGTEGAAALVQRLAPSHILVLDSADAEWQAVWPRFEGAYAPSVRLEGATLFSHVGPPEDGPALGFTGSD